MFYLFLLFCLSYTRLWILEDKQIQALVWKNLPSLDNMPLINFTNLGNLCPPFEMNGQTLKFSYYMDKSL